AAADVRAGATRALSDAEQGSRAAAFDRERAEQTYRDAVEREAAARTDLASEAARAVRGGRVDTVTHEIARVEARLASTIEDLASQERALDAAEVEFRRDEDRRRE